MRNSGEKTLISHEMLQMNRSVRLLKISAKRFMDSDVTTDAWSEVDLQIDNLANALSELAKRIAQANALMSGGKNG